jgi:hypothetical protein
MNTEKIISRHPLANGLTLEILDQSRPVAGDRYLVVLKARIKVPVTVETMPAELKSQANHVTKALGEEIVYDRRDERNFIAAADVPALFQEMTERLLALAPGYFAHPEFAPRIIRKKYAEILEKQRCSG